MLQLSSYPELIALHKALLEAKFNSTPNDSLLAGSPYLAQIAQQVIEAIIDLETAMGDSDAEAKWKEWRQINSLRREWQVAIDRVKEAKDMWIQWSNEEKTSYARVVLSPFIIEEHLLKTFITQVEESLSE